MDVLGNPRDPSTRGSWIVDFPAHPRDPSTRGSWIVDLLVPSEDDPKTHGLGLKLAIFPRSLRSRLYLVHASFTSHRAFKAFGQFQTKDLVDGCYDSSSAARKVHEGVVDCGLPRSSTGPFHKGVVDCGLSRRSTGPFHEGVVECGFSETSEPCTGGGALQSDLHIMYRARPWYTGMYYRGEGVNYF